ncbi:MAG: hypothetical protein KIT81_05240 [Alphaproteobacteria bacterium]|nr:hypothetical protein [Alphaproteobacteria bacterium]
MLFLIGLALLASASVGILNLRNLVNRGEPPALLRSELMVELLLLGYMTLSILGICIILKQFL